MAVFRVVKSKNYSILNNFYMRNKNLSLRAIGLLTLVLSLPNDFKYSIGNLVRLTSETERTIKKLLKELKNNGYLVVSKKKDDKGYYYYEYIWFESNSLNPEFNYHNMEKIDIPNQKRNIRVNPEVKNYTMETSENSNEYNENNKNPEYNIEELRESPLYLKNTNNYKIDIDKNKLNLCFLTEYLVEWDFIKLNNIDIFGYDEYLINLLSQHKEEYKLVIKVVSYVVKRIKSNKYLDEDGNPIVNLLAYFIGSCNTNITMLKENADLVIDDDFWLKGLETVYK